LARKAKLVIAEAKNTSDLRPALTKAIKQGAGALIVCADPFFTSQYKEIVALTQELNLPAGFPWRQYAEEGGLMSFGPKLSDAYFQVGAYSGMILNGIKPEALRVQAPKDNEFELVINGATARKLNVEIPRDSDRRIEVI
jgi:putative ABC transport system substrate-binding protein